MSGRFAAIDIGTNSVLLLIAERDAQGRFSPVVERAEITRLGRGVDQSHVLSAEGMEETLRTLEAYSKEAHAARALGVVVTATSAARDAQNGAGFLAAAKARTGLHVEIISGEEEARLAFAAVKADDSVNPDGRPLVVIDIGGGSTELIYSGEATRAGEVQFRRSFDVGSVRLSERYFRNQDVISPHLQQEVADALDQTFAQAPPPPADAVVVGVAGTVTTLFAVENAIDPYDPARIQGGILSLSSLVPLRQKLAAMPLKERRTLPGLQPKRADVIPAGALILERALLRLGASQCVVSDRGLRWGLLADRFGNMA